MPTRLLRASLIGLVVAVPVSINAQVQVAAPTRSTTMGREILLLDFAAGANARATLPAFVTRVRANDGEPEIRPDGYMQMVVKDGQPMLKASGQVALLVTLPEALPADFTVEFDLIPKPCCNPEDISFEGTKAIDGGLSPLKWHGITMSGRRGACRYAVGDSGARTRRRCRRSWTESWSASSRESSSSSRAIGCACSRTASSTCPTRRQ